MCPVEKVTTCQITFIPIATEDYKEDVNNVLALIAKSGMDHQVGDVSTTIKGDRQKIWELVSKIYEEMDNKCKFVLDLKISNLCGCG